MKYQLTIEGDFYEDWNELKEFAHLRDITSAVHEARQKLRSQLKHGDIEDEKVIRFLEELQDLLYIPALED